MYFTTPVALAILAFADSILGAPTCENGGYNHPAETAGAVYFITNAKQNSVVSIPIGANGLLSGEAVLTPTGGMGLGSMRADGTAAIPDSLFSQSAVHVVDNLLFTVNPGSNTVSMFKISPENPSELTLIGKPQSSGGEFPVSVTYSSALSTACVLNGGAVDGVSCYSVDTKYGLRILDASPRLLGIGQKTPAVGPPGTASEITFSQDSSVLIVTVKGNPAVGNTGFIATYPVSHGVVSRQVTKSSPSGTTLPFGVSDIGLGKFIMADPSVGGAILTIDPASFKTSATILTVAGQVAICWTAYSPVTKTAFLADAGVNRIVEVDPATGAIASEMVLTNGNRGMFDIAASGNYLYALAPTANSTHVVVMDISGGKGMIKEAQNFEVIGLGLGTVMGLRVYAATGKHY